MICSSSLEKHESVADRMCARLASFISSRATDRQYILLTLEFKLFALRHPKLRARLADSHRRIRASLNHEALDKLLPPAPRSVPAPNSIRFCLALFSTGLVLEHACDPKRISAKQTVRKR